MATMSARSPPKPDARQVHNVAAYFPCNCIMLSVCYCQTADTLFARCGGWRRDVRFSRRICAVRMCVIKCMRHVWCADKKGNRYQSGFWRVRACSCVCSASTHMPENASTCVPAQITRVSVIDETITRGIQEVYA